MNIRPFQQQDFSRILDIYAHSKLDELIFESNKFILIPLDQDQKRLKAFKASQVFVYEEHDISGYLALDNSEIGSLFVHADHRGKGIGAALLNFALTKIQYNASLHVVSSNAPAKKLYIKQGFKKVEGFMAQYNGLDVQVDKMIHQSD
ncbi:MAG: N-acetyltransferase [Bermanella sp.]